jgi:hypothetical protein
MTEPNVIFAKLKPQKLRHKTFFIKISVISKRPQAIAVHLKNKFQMLCKSNRNRDDNFTISSWKFVIKLESSDI